MEERRRDVLICGVNGFTAQKLLEYIVSNRPDMTLGVTCRSKEKLEMTLTETETKTKKSLNSVERHITGVDSPGKLARIFRGYKVVINCIGPFSKTGISVVEASIEAKSHYVDCTGEPGFIEESMGLFQERARQNEVMVVHACGFDSLPIDIGINYTVNEVVKKEGKAEYAESYMHLVNSRINLGTFKTIIASMDMLKKRKKDRSSKRDTPAGEKKDRASRKVRKIPFYSSEVGMYAVLFPGSDAYVLRKTRSLLGRDYPMCFCYIAVPSLAGVLFLALFCLLVGFVYLLPETLRRIAYAYIDVLSLGRIRSEGPTVDEISSSGFQTKIFAHGTDKDGKKTVFRTVVSGPDPGYVTTPISLLISAETILLNTDGILKGKGGVYTPGALFADTNIIQRLTQERIMFCTATKKR